VVVVIVCVAQHVIAEMARDADLLLEKAANSPNDLVGVLKFI
jgi:hypothetical protein